MSSDDLTNLLHNCKLAQILIVIYL